MDPKTRTEAIEWGPRELGCGVTIIELTIKHVEDAFDDAVRWWVGRRGLKKHAVAQTFQGTQTYTAPDDCDEVLEVWFPGVQFDVIAAIEPYAFIDVDMLPAAYQSLTGIPGGSFYGTISQIIAHAETARRIISSEPAWRYFKSDLAGTPNQIMIFPRNRIGGVMIIRYISDALVSDDPPLPATTPINQFRILRVRDRDIILKYYLATLKQKLGRVRSKYSEWPSAGGSKTLDGDTLLAEAQTELAELKEEIMGLSDGVPFLTG